MAVFTSVDADDLAPLLDNYFESPRVHSLQGIPAGIENTNYFLDVGHQAGESRLVLTLFEMGNDHELPVFVELTQHLAARGEPVPAPLRDKQGVSIHRLAGKAALLVPRLEGGVLETVTDDVCFQVGVLLARLHQEAEGVKARRPVVRDQSWCESTGNAVQPFMEAGEAKLLQQELAFQRQSLSTWQSCPKGWVHGDLFVDNVLFAEGTISGVIDFYHACEDFWLMDIAVACNDWCWENGRYQASLLQALVAGYSSLRSLTTNEQSLWSSALRLGALRFWLSRLRSKHLQSYQQQVQEGDVIKDPDAMRSRLEQAKEQTYPR